MVPAIRTMALGWRPLSDDANIAIGAWRSLSLHPPLVGVLTGAIGKLASDPGPLELWLLGPFVHLDPGQGALLGSALLCAAVLSLTLYVLVKTAGIWSGVVFSLCVADLAVDLAHAIRRPGLEHAFGLFWFLSFLGVAFAVGMGNLRYLALLVFIGSVTVDSHLMYLPSCVVVLAATAVSGYLLGRPQNYRWAVWAGCRDRAVLGPVTGSSSSPPRDPISRCCSEAGVTSPGQKTEGFVFGLRALSRAASVFPIWASPRPIAAFRLERRLLSSQSLALPGRARCSSALRYGPGDRPTPNCSACAWCPWAAASAWSFSTPTFPTVSCCPSCG